MMPPRLSLIARGVLLAACLMQAAPAAAVAPASWNDTGFAIDASGLRLGRVLEQFGAAYGVQVDSRVPDALLPQVDPASRTQRARIVLRNPQGRLAPGMFAQVRIESRGTRPLPLVPNEALIATGDDSRVIVRAADGSFVPVRVRTGRSSEGRTEVLAGLAGGEQVVVSGQFLIDSEASLTGALQRLAAPAPAADAQP